MFEIGTPYNGELCDFSTFKVACFFICGGKTIK